MGFIRHDAIIVTAGTPDHAELARKRAVELGLQCTDIQNSHSNGYDSFLIIPDGSKEGWEESDKGNERREAWIKWVRANRHDLWVDWMHVKFGGDDREHPSIVDFFGKENE